MKVCKFGGTSVANAEQIRKVCNIVLADSDRKIVVVSAPGKRFDGDIKVTDLLIACAQEYKTNGKKGEAFEHVIARFEEIKTDMDLPQETVTRISQDLTERLEMDRTHEAKYIDTIKAAGEDYAARIVADAFVALGHEAHYMNPKDGGLLLNDDFGNAQVLPESYDTLGEALQDAPGITVFPGFFGYTLNGEVATFPRGGSDITGAILAAAVHAYLYENFTDVDSVFCTDPRIVQNPQAITEITYREMRELSYAGFSVFHAEAVQPAIRANVAIAIKNTNRPEAPGTRILPQREHVIGDAVGIASSPGFCSIFIEKFLMNRMVGFAHRLLGILLDEDISFQHMPSGIDNLSIIVREERFPPEVEKRVLDRIEKELSPQNLSVERNLALIMIVGEGMSHSVGVAARATRAFAEAGVNIEMINQGSSEISMMFGVKEADREAAIQLLYDEFFEHPRA